MKSSRLQQVMALVCGLSTMMFSLDVVASDWAAGNGNWNSNANPGWNGTGIPNSIGAIAQKVDGASGTATINIAGGVTVGSIIMGGSSNAAFGVSPSTNSLILNQDGAGSGFAQILNINTNTGIAPAVIVNTGTVTLQDDLLISNQSNSTRPTGAVIFSGTLGGTGNVTIESISNVFPASTSSFAGAVRIQTGVNTFSGNVLVRRGMVVFNNNNSFGASANALALGESFQGDVSVLSTAAVMVPQNITIAGGTGGTTLLGSNSTSNATSGFGYSGSITLNGDVRTTSASLTGPGPVFSGNISGGGGLSHIGNAAGLGTLGTATLSGMNTYAGTTTVLSGTLQFAKQTAFYNNNPADWIDTKLIVNPGAVASFYVGGTGEFTDTDIQTINAIGSGSGGFTSGSGLGFNTSSGDFTYANNFTDNNGGLNSIALVKYGSNTLNLTGANTHTGGTVLVGGTLSLGSAGALGTTGPITFLGGTLQFTGANTTDYSARFATVANQAFNIDTNGQSVAFATAPTSTGGTLTKSGAGTLALNAASAYTGTTTILNGSVDVNVTNALGTAHLVIGDQTATVGTLNVNANQTIASLNVQSNAASNSTIAIASGQTLTLTGSALANSLVVGTQTSTANPMDSRLAVTGANGTLRINDVSRNIVVAQRSTSTIANSFESTLDLSGLGTFDADVSNIYVGRPTDSAGAAVGERSNGLLRLANQNTINVGNNIVVAGTSASTVPSSGHIKLGTSNDIGAAQWVVGNGRATGTVTFDSGLTNPSASIFGAGGAMTRTNIVLGDQRNGTSVGGGGGSTNMTGTMDFSDGTIYANINNLTLGNGASVASSARGVGNGVFVFGGADSYVNINALTIAVNSSDTSSHLTGGSPAVSSTGTFTMNGGILAVNNSFILANDIDTSNTTNGVQSVTGTFNLNGGTATIGSNAVPVDTVMGAHVTSGNSGVSTATLSINGGTYVSTGAIRRGNAGAGTIVPTVNLNGGRLNMTGDNIGTATAVITFNAQAGRLSNVGAINGTGGLTKTTAGTLTVDGTIGYTGPTAVNDGTLRFQPSSTANLAAVTTAASTTLIVSQFSTASTAVDSTSVTTGAGSNLNFELLGTPTAAPLTAIAFDPAATTTINVATSGALGIGQFSLVDYTTIGGGGFGALTLGALPPRMAANLVDNVVNTSVDLNVTAFDTIRWNGDVSGDWDVGTSPGVGGTNNWKLNSDSSATNYVSGDIVTFDDTAAGNFNVNVTTAVTPGAITFNNSTNDYTLSGTGGISTSLLTKNGTGKATLSNSGGALDIASIALNSGTLAVNRTDSVTLSSTLSGAGALRKEGTNTVSLSGDSSGYTGTVTAADGTLKVLHSNALGSGAGGTTVASGATLDIHGTAIANATPGTSETVTVSGSGVGGAGALYNSIEAGQNGVVPNVVLAGDTTIGNAGGGYTIGGTATTGYSFSGNGFNLTVGGTGQIDLTNVGNINVNNITVSNGAYLFAGGDTTLGPTSGTLTLENNARFGVYGSLAGGAIPSTGTIDKPIVVAAGGTSGIEMKYNSGLGKVVSSPITMDGDLEAIVYNQDNTTTSTLTLTGDLTGAGALTVHLNADGTASRTGMVELTSNSNSYAGVTTIGGGFGLSNVTTANDRVTLSIGNGGATGSIGPNNVVINSPGVLRFNRADTFSFGNQISGSGSVEAVSATGFVTITGGSNTYAGETRIDGGTVKVTGNHTAMSGNNYRVASAAGTTGNLILDGATITNGGGLMVGENGTGSVTIESGSYTFKADNAGGGQFIGIGRNAGGVGTYTQNGGDVTVVGDWFVASPAGGVGHVFLNGGTINSFIFALTQTNAGSSDFTMTGGAVNVVGGYANIGLNGSATYTQSGGTFTVANAGQRFSVGENSTGNGTFTLSGTGTVAVPNDWFIFGRFGSATGSMSDNTTITAPVFVTSEFVGSSSNFAIHGGTINTTWMDLGYRSNSTVLMDGGTINAPGELLIGSFKDGTNVSLTTFTMNANTNSMPDPVINSGEIWVGYDNKGIFNQNAGTITSTNFLTIAETANADGSIYNLAGGSLSLQENFVMGYEGDATMNHTGGSVTLTNWYVISYQSTANSTTTIDGATASVVVDSSNPDATQIMVGLNGTGTLNMKNGTLEVKKNGDVRVGDNSTGIGVLNQTGGTISTEDWTYISRSGTGTYNMDGGIYNAGDNFAIALNASTVATRVGVMNMTGGTVNVLGNEPSYTGNFLVGRNGKGTLNMTGGTINMITPPNGTGVVTDPNIVRYGTNNSASFSLSQATSALDALLLAQDGNLSIGEEIGTGALNLSGTTTTINVAANVFVGGFEADSASADFMVGGKGTLTISGGTMNVGTTSLTGGDMIIGSPATGNLAKPGVVSIGTVNLKGGLLNVANGSGSTGGWIASGGNPATKQFNFTGGTLKVRSYNPSSMVDTGPGLGALVQTAADANSKLDLTTNDTSIRGGYSLAGDVGLVRFSTAQVSAGRILTITNSDTVNGNLTVGANGIVQNSGTVAVANNADFSAGGTLLWGLSSILTSTPGADFGLMNVSGDLILGGLSKLDLDFTLLGTDGPNSSHAFWDANHSWKIVDTATNNANASFASLLNAIYSNGYFTTSIGAGADAGDIFLNFTVGSAPLAGDFDFDGDVDGADFIAWQTNYPATYDGGDFADWQNNFPTPGPGPGSSPVPEPSAWLLGSLAAVGLLTLRRRSLRG